jgi:hypothetical protein
MRKKKHFWMNQQTTITIIAFNLIRSNIRDK